MSKKLLHGLGLLLLAYIIYKVGPARLANLLRHADLPLLLLAVGMLLPITVVFSLRFYLLLREHGLPIGLASVVRYSLLGQYYGFITPGKVGSFVRVYLISTERGIPLRCSFFPVLYDRLGDILGMGLLAFLGSVVLFKHNSIFLIVSCALMASFAIAVAVVMKRREVLRGAAAVLRVIVPKRIYDQAMASSRDLGSQVPASACIWACALLSVAGWALIFFQGWLVALNFTRRVPLLDYLFVAPIASVVGLVPVTVSGFGTREAFFLYLMTFYGVAGSSALLISLMAYFVNAGIPSLVGALVAVFELAQAKGANATLARSESRPVSERESR